MRPNFKKFGRQEPQVPIPPRPVHPVDVIADREPTGRLINLPLSLIRPNPNQPRKHFDQEALDELAASIREHGVLQPILVRKDAGAEGYIIIAGERRYRAATIVALEKMPAIIRPEENHREIAIIENVQRENLNPIELAEGLLELKQNHGYTDEALAKALGKPRTVITETVSLTRLPDTIKAECRARDIGTKRQLLGVLRAGSEEKMLSLWEALKSGEVSTTRQIEAHNRKPKGRPTNYRFSFRPKGGAFAVNVTFSKAQATAEEVRKALLDAAESLDGDA